MIPVEQMEYDPLSEKITDILCAKTQNSSRHFFRLMVAYYLSKIAATMRCEISTFDRGDIPVNSYVINLAPSGMGKGYSMNILEESIINKFRTEFMESTLPDIEVERLSKLATREASKNNTDPDEELVAIEKKYKELGPLLFSFDSGTTPALKQLRQKLLMSEIGSLNFELDEISSNLLSNTELLTAFLELYDVGKIKQKLIKNTSDNKRFPDIPGRTPANMLLFGTPVKLFNKGKAEEEFWSMLEIGYARRCLFGLTNTANDYKEKSPEEVYNSLTDSSLIIDISNISDYIKNLADISFYNRKITVSKEISLKLIQYKLDCERTASEISEYQEILKAELTHRYYKALKLAGVYAFIDGSLEVTEKHLFSAIKLTEDSGKAFVNINKRERAYAKLAKYIAEVPYELTHADLTEDLPFYRGSESHKKDMLNLAIAYGYKNNIIIKRSFNNGIEFITGETLKKTDQSKMVVSYGTHLAEGYKNDYAPFDKIHKLTQHSGLHWVNHHLEDGYRREDNCIEGFNLVVIDVDSGASIDEFEILLKDYQYHLYTTKRHTDSEHRYRVVFPLSHTLNLTAEDYKEFMENFYDWLPVKVDTQTNQRARKWLSHTGYYTYNTGKPINALLFIPNTSEQTNLHRRILDTSSLSNLERWFILNTGEGNRSNQLIKYAYVLIDLGYDLATIDSMVNDLNDKLSPKLSKQEISSTIMRSVANKLANK